MVLFIDSISKITKGKTVYKIFDKKLIETLFESNNVIQPKPMQVKKTSLREFRLNYSNISTEKVVNAYKAYYCGLISKEQKSIITRNYNESNVKNC